MFEFFVFSLLFEALWLLASVGFFRYNQDGGNRGRKASVASEKIRNTRFGTNRGRLPDFFMQPSRRRSLAGVTARRYFVAKNQRTQKPQVIRKKIGLPMLTHRESRFLTAKKLSYRGRIIQPCCWRLPARVCGSV